MVFGQLDAYEIDRLITLHELYHFNSSLNNSVDLKLVAFTNLFKT